MLVLYKGRHYEAFKSGTKARLHELHQYGKPILTISSARAKKARQAHLDEMERCRRDAA